MNKKVLVIIAIIIAILIGGVSFIKLGNKDIEGDKSQETIKITHRYGETMVPKNPKKVVVLDLGAADIMEVLGVEIAGLPKANLPVYLQGYKDDKYVDLGTLKEFNMEKVNELKPDLIIIEGRQEPFYEELSKIAPTIGLGTLDNDFIGSVKTNTEIIGKIFDKEKEAEKELAKVTKSIEDINKKVTGANKNALLTMVSEGSISVYGKNSRFSLMYNELGFKIADEDIKDGKHGQSISYEYLLDKNPEYLFVIDKGRVLKGEQEAAEKVMKNDITLKMDAFKNDKVVYLDTQTWYLGGSGIRAIERMLEEIKAVI